MEGRDLSLRRSEGKMQAHTASASRSFVWRLFFDSDGIVPAIGCRFQTQEDPGCRHQGSSGKWSGRRDSNSRRPPWQGGALPTELRPQIRGGIRFAPSPAVNIISGRCSRVKFRKSRPFGAFRGCPRRFPALNNKSTPGCSTRSPRPIPSGPGSGPPPGWASSARR
jgi:hypothetical protein